MLMPIIEKTNLDLHEINDFVMNNQQEIYDAYADYRKDQFGGWPWDRYDPVHLKESGRFARYSDGREEKP